MRRRPSLGGCTRRSPLRTWCTQRARRQRACTRCRGRASRRTRRRRMRPRAHDAHGKVDRGSVADGYVPAGARGAGSRGRPWHQCAGSTPGRGSSRTPAELMAPTRELYEATAQAVQLGASVRSVYVPATHTVQPAEVTDAAWAP
jgi:hypothetical protein